MKHRVLAALLALGAAANLSAQAPATDSARDIEHRDQEHIQYLAVDDANVALNINTPEDYTALVPKV